MKYRFTLFSLLLFIFLSAIAQKKSNSTTHLVPGRKAPATTNKEATNSGAKATTESSNAASNSVKEKNITGIWKGYFVQNSLGFGDDRYRYEVQIADNPNHSLTSVTYSYKTTVFYGKAEAQGIYTVKTNDVLIREVKLVDVKITGEQTDACLMTCYLDYNKMGTLETLTGTYSSVNIKSGGDCGSGRVYLEKSPVTDFYKEDFLVKRENELKVKEKAVAKKPAPVTTPKSSTVSKPKTPVAKKLPVKPGAEGDLVSNKKETKNPEATTIVPKAESPNKPSTPPVVKIIPKPEVIKRRENELIKTITTSEKEFKIELYDNGEVDGDRISVYHNNELIVSNQPLTNKAISFTIRADEGSKTHEFVMVAENLGTIPPNTALMIITAGAQRHELFVTSTERKNAVVRVEYKPE